MKTKFLFMITSIVLSIFFFSTSVYADGITIGNGSRLTLDDGSIDMGCLNITIEDGGTLDIGSGKISRLKNLVIISGGTFIPGTGSVSYCGVLSPGIIKLLLME